MDILGSFRPDYAILDLISKIPLWKMNPTSQGHIWIKQTTSRPLLESPNHFITQCDPPVYQTPDDHKIVLITRFKYNTKCSTKWLF